MEFIYYYPKRPNYALPFVDEIKGKAKPEEILAAYQIPATLLLN
jgi:hypothetical protein